jgi:hypothetical protein
MARHRCRSRASTYSDQQLEPYVPYYYQAAVQLGSNDPWGAEPFELGFGSKDSYRYFVPGGNHGSNIAQLPAAQSAEATGTFAGFPGFDADPLTAERPRL